MNQFNYHRKIIIIVIPLAVFAMVGLAQTETITVVSEREYDFYKIQDGINAAKDGDVVLVAPGEYVVTSEISFGGKAITVKSKAGPQQTIIRPYQDYDGNIFTFDKGEDSRTMLEGFTIKDCNERGVSCVNSSPRIENCVFTDNWESGIQCLNASPIISNSIITGSKGDSGINCRENSSPTITNCIIFSNSCDGSGGGGIYCNDSSPIITDCTITKNAAPDNEGGGILCLNASPTIINCTISNNIANHGAGMRNIKNSSPTLINCTFSGNLAEYDGGSISNQDSNPKLINCTISNNSTD
jgi:hypothetical protein